MRNLLLLVLASCAAAPALAFETPATPKTPPPIEVPRSTWSEVTRSQWSASPRDPRIQSLATACGEEDGALDAVAERVLALPTLDADGVVPLLRERGVPHLHPRLVKTSGHAPLDPRPIAKQLSALSTSTTRCGVAIAKVDGEEALVAIVLDALADLDPIPTRARTGQWLTVTAAVNIPTRSAKLVVLGPRGAPRTFPTSLAQGKVKARFPLDRPGDFTVQIVADTERGPLPVLEARVFADVEPTTEMAPAPGEDQPDLGKMVAALRLAEGLSALTRDPRLDALAQAQADAMRDRKMVAHDLGDGDLALRFESEGLAARAVGENVARATSLSLAHRALHASPSHRLNLLRADYTHLGIGTATDDAGTVYACQVFAAGLKP